MKSFKKNSNLTILCKIKNSIGYEIVSTQAKSLNITWIIERSNRHLNNFFKHLDYFCPFCADVRIFLGDFFETGLFDILSKSKYVIFFK